MRTALGCIALSLVCALAGPAPAAAQDWTTLGNDAQRSSWLRSSAKITAQSVQTPEFQLLWKRELDTQARGRSSITPPVLLDFLISHKGFRSLAFLGGADSSVFAVDTDLNRMEWERRFGEAIQYPEPNADCPGGMTASLSRPTVAAMPSLGGFAGPRRRSPGFSGVGEPNEGAVTLKEERPVRRTTPAPKPSARKRPPQGRVLRGLSVVHALTADGMLRTLLVSNGYDYGSPMPFLPAHANAKGLMVVDSVAYAATSNDCGGAPNGVWALDTESGKVTSWKAGAASVAGMAGFAMGPDGTVYAATTDGRVVALAASTLAQQAVYKAGGGYVSAPVVIDHNDQDYLAVAARDGSVALFDAGRLQDGPLSKTAGGGGFASGALATWIDSNNVKWVVAPKAGAVEAWKLAESTGKLALEKGWSAAVESPLPPIVVNGLVFAASSGDLRRSTPAVLYAFDGATGKRLWTSGKAITGAAPASGLSAGPNTVYMGTHDGALYGFGFPIEH